jgi:hypothetical protein
MYARQLQQQQQFQQQQQQFEQNPQSRRSNISPERAPNNNLQDALHNEMMAKRQKQAEYARDLEQQMQQHEYQKIMEKQQRMAQPQYTFDSEKNQERDLKRQKQVEYNLALQQQIQNGVQKNKIAIDNYQPMPPSSTNASQWVIGPLGVPVRKTLEVGNRGLQKVFNQSPSKVPMVPPNLGQLNYDYMDQYNQQETPSFHSNVPFYPLDLPQPQMGIPQPQMGMPQAMPPIKANMQFGAGLNSNQMNAQLDMGGGLIDVQAEREAKKKRLQEEHQHALEQQIALKKAQQMEEKMKKDQVNIIIIIISIIIIKIIIIIKTLIGRETRS